MFGLVFGGLVLASCGHSTPKEQTLVGPVTTVSQSAVCVGTPKAGGACFARDAATANLRVGDCVRVTYTPADSSSDNPTASDVQEANASDCSK